MFSVVIPLYNKEKCIANTIQSVLDQTFADFEIIVVNDGSTDNGLSIVQSFEDDRITIIHKPNGGVSSARNQGIKEAKYEWIAFLDADDFWDPNYLKEMESLIRDFPEASIFGCAIGNCSAVKQPIIDLSLPPLYRGIIQHYFQHARSTFLFSSSSVVVSKNAILTIGGFDERIHMGEDIDVWYRINMKFKSAFYNKVLSHYNLDAPNRAMNKKREFTKSYWCYTSKYKEFEIENEEFQKFINWYRCRGILDLFQHYEINNFIMKDYMATINIDRIPLKWKIYCKSPFYFKKIIAILYKYIQ